jgi:hypothetical protein
MLVLKTLIITILKNLAKILLAPKMIIWAAEVTSEWTDNDVDDPVVALLKAAYYNDPDGVRIAAEKILEQV